MGGRGSCRAASLNQQSEIRNQQCECMPTYRYEASGANGKVTAGHIQAADLKAASEQLRARGEYILSLSPVESVGHKGKVNFSINFGPGAKDVQNFTSQLAVMIRAGISIRSAIDGISE